MENACARCVAVHVRSYRSVESVLPLGDQQRRDVLEILEDRDALRSTIVTSQVPIENWHDYIAHPPIADAVLDRLVHDAYKLKMKGPSRRKEKAQTA